MTVTVTGTGTATVPATSASVSFNIIASDTSVRTVVDVVTARAAVMRTALITNGIPETEIMQTQVTVTSVTGGYQALIQFAIKTKNVANVSSLISMLYDNGASSVAQPVLIGDNQSGFVITAFEDAMKDANTQAGQIGLKHWKLIRKIVNVSQTSSATTSTATSIAAPTADSRNQMIATNGVFQVAQVVSVTYKMW